MFSGEEALPDDQVDPNDSWRREWGWWGDRNTRYFSQVSAHP